MDNLGPKRDSLNTKKFTCNICEKALYISQILWDTKFQLGEKPYKCDAYDKR